MSEETKIDIIPSNVEINVEKIKTTAELDYISHMQTLKDFEDLYKGMYIHNNLYGKWEIK